MGMNLFGPVIFIDDEEEVRLSGAQALEIEGFEVIPLDSAKAALDYISVTWPGIIVTDVKMPFISGLELLHRTVAIDKDLPVVLITGHGDVSMAVDAMHAGAYDFIEKPADMERLIDVVRRASEKRNLILENRALRMAREPDSEIERRIMGLAPSMLEVRRTLIDIADTNVDVLIHGETGTGKELVARCLHDYGFRREKRFVALNCGALPESIIESELFGHEAGAFTGANKRRIGKIEYAGGGTLFLDEVESMPLAIQVRLLRVLQERTIERLGGNETIPVDVRVIAATKKNLLELASDERFREDLYYRLHVASISLPPLRERLEDIPTLFRRFVEEASDRFRRITPEINETTIQELLARVWPGNVRELKNVAERFVLGMVVTKTDDINTSDYSLGESLTDKVSAFECETIKDSLTKNSGRIGKTAESLKIPRKKLYLRMQKYGLNPDKFK